MIGFEFCNISIDLLFCQLATSTVPRDLDILDDDVLIGVDEASYKSLNGPRVTYKLTQLVPDYPTFTLVLRCLRVWAKARGLYSNKMGYLGGVNYAILCAFACQLYPKVSAATLLLRVFQILDTWPWPAPIRLVKQYEPNNAANPRQQWDPTTNKYDRGHLMPIIVSQLCLFPPLFLLSLLLSSTLPPPPSLFPLPSSPSALFLIQSMMQCNVM